ncbi:DUF2891 family protein [uncultured Propionibacterium sp.]|uniref:DUF2891 family protein n=1 Tax=uncultured Propionibacterium sp. TaxID=218066 RepID=UPI00292FE937|nr:DUF2891 family protein [uncultured Propionibacterium sp.]
MSSTSQCPDWRARWAVGWAQSLLRSLETPTPWVPFRSSTAAGTSPDAQSLHPRADDDWHSSAHMQWAALVLLRTAPGELGPELRRTLTGALRRRWRGGAIGVEADHLRTHRDAGRPLGWAWTAMLAAEARRNEVAVRYGWDEQLDGLARAVSMNLARALARVGTPVRLGTDRNTAFSMGLLLDAFRALEMAGPVSALGDRARSWFCGRDRSSSAVDPCPNDICSPALAQADLVRRVLPGGVFDGWLAGFLPRLGSAGDTTLRFPVLHGEPGGGGRMLPPLALTRALHLRHLAPHLPRARGALASGSADRLVHEAAPLITTAGVSTAHLLVPLAVLAVRPPA